MNILEESQTVVVKVTKKDIKQGKIKDCHRCPIALALYRSLKDKVKITVANLHVSLSLQGERGWGGDFAMVPLPMAAEDFIVSFDKTKGKSIMVKPFQFSLKISKTFLKEEKPAVN